MGPIHCGLMSSNSSGHREKELIPAFALGALEPEERLQVIRHLDRCAICREEERAYAQAVTLLAYEVDEVEPPPQLKERMLRAIDERAVSPKRASAPVVAEPPRRRRRWPSVRLAPLAAVLLLAVVVISAALLFWREDGRIADIAPAGFSAVLLQPGPAAPDARGVMLISATGEYGTLVVQDLPKPEKGREYQVWLVNDRLYDGGTFSVYHGYRSLTVEAGPPLSSFARVFVTLEPEGGSPAPTGPVVLANDI